MPPESRLRRLVILALVFSGLGALAGCGAAASRAEQVRVFAAASLAEVFREMGQVYRRSHPAARFRFDFAGSPELVGRLREREPADVLVTADRTAMDSAAKYVTGPRPVAGNSMTIAVPPGNPKKIRGLPDLARPRVRTVLGAPSVPAGRYARQVLSKARVTIRPASEETSSRAVLDRVRTGEADAGIVYITDMGWARAAAGSVPIPAAQNATVTYFAAAVKESDHEKAGRAFVDWLRSAQARALFAEHGFTAP